MDALTIIQLGIEVAVIISCSALIYLLIKDKKKK